LNVNCPVGKKVRGFNTKRIGDQYERMRRKWHEGQGRSVEKSIHTRGHQDFFGCADLIIIDHANNRVVLEQITTRHNRRKGINALRFFPVPACVRKVAVFYERGKDGWEEEVVE
jgi:phage terminase large subunit-like protein